MYTRSIKYIKLNNFTVTLRELETCGHANRMTRPEQQQQKKCSQINYNHDDH